MHPDRSPSRVPVRILATLAMVAAFGIALPATPSAAAAQPLPGPGDDTGPFSGAYGCTTGGAACFLVWQYHTPPAIVVDPPGAETYEFLFQVRGTPPFTMTAVDSWLLTFASGATRTVTPGQLGTSTGIATDFQQADGDFLVGSSVTFQTPDMAAAETLALTPYTYSPTVTPEPATVALLGSGLLGVGAVGWRRQRAGASRA